MCVATGVLCLQGKEEAKQWGLLEVAMLRFNSYTFTATVRQGQGQVWMQ